jgi:hypothetical protein
VTSPSVPLTHEREITEPVDLCLPGGRLDPDAVGWTRRPLHRANLRGWGRTKRWEYWGIVTPTHVVGVTISSLDYAGVHGLYVLDRATGVETARDVVVPLARQVSLPERSGSGSAWARSSTLDVRIDNLPDADGHGASTRLRAEARGVRLDLTMPVPDGHESLGVVVPWSDRLFQYTVKDLARPVSGGLRLGDGGDAVVHMVDAADSFAVLDHGRGRWPYRMTWNWAAGSGHGRGIQLGGKWADGTGMTENALLVDGRIHKLGAELGWEYDRRDWLVPWTITGPRVEATFHPFHERVSRTELGVVGSETHQCFGEFRGRAQADDGAWVPLDGLVGWAEEARQRW